MTVHGALSTAAIELGAAYRINQNHPTSVVCPTRLSEASQVCPLPPPRFSRMQFRSISEYFAELMGNLQYYISISRGCAELLTTELIMIVNHLSVSSSIMPFPRLYRFSCCLLSATAAVPLGSALPGRLLSCMDCTIRKQMMRFRIEITSLRCCDFRSNTILDYTVSKIID